MLKARRRNCLPNRCRTLLLISCFSSFLSSQEKKSNNWSLNLVTNLTAFGFWNKRETLCLQSSGNLSFSLNMFVVLGVIFKTSLSQKLPSDKWGFLRYWRCPLSDPVKATAWDSWDISGLHSLGYRWVQAHLPCIYSHPASDILNALKPWQMLCSDYKCRFLNSQWCSLRTSGAARQTFGFSDPLSSYFC